jgi:hypothetical protein
MLVPSQKLRPPSSSTLMKGTGDLDEIRPLHRFSRVLDRSNPRTLSEH